MITFTTSDRADALYYYNGLASGRVVSGSYSADDHVRSFVGLVVSVEPGDQPDEAVLRSIVKCLRLPGTTTIFQRAAYDPDPSSVAGFCRDPVYV